MRARFVTGCVLLTTVVSATAAAQPDVRETFAGMGYEIAPASDPIEHRLRLDLGAAITSWDLSTPWLDFALDAALVVGLHNTFDDQTGSDSAARVGGHLGIYPLGIALGHDRVGAVFRVGGAVDAMGRHRPLALELPSRLDVYLPASVVVAGTITWFRSERSDPVSRVDVAIAVPLRRPRETRYRGDRPILPGLSPRRSVEFPGQPGVVLRLTGSVNRDDVFIGVQVGFGGVRE